MIAGHHPRQLYAYYINVPALASLIHTTYTYTTCVSVLSPTNQEPNIWHSEPVGGGLMLRMDVVA